jgi:hypothetical protein
MLMLKKKKTQAYTCFSTETMLMLKKQNTEAYTPVLVLKQYTSDGRDAMLNAAIQY